MRVGGRAYLPNMLNWSDSEYTQSSQTCKDERFRMTNFLSCSVNGLLCKPSVGCLLLPKSLISSKMASRIHYDLANTHNSFNSELGRSHNFFYVHFFFLFARQKEKTNQKRKTRLSKQTLMHLSSKFNFYTARKNKFFLSLPLLKTCHRHLSRRVLA